MKITKQICLFSSLFPSFYRQKIKCTEGKIYNGRYLTFYTISLIKIQAEIVKADVDKAVVL